ncbi:MAG: serine hydrolase domain-containing protein [Phenylobacterium sp.]|uniref:serine hydrolase domain-containing protein n=1 Tax=Phenylobacterium sp. TaxID=1871053 RepID=UPI002734EA64|nr:serine hydrolase domain-containing protein [Phenylobacterium sp.]MDP3746733.1 serine hydrolase domain-containing protein [Phenylobacterium sp.]
MYSRFETALDAAVAGGRVAGAVALVADRNGVIYETAAGLRKVGDTAVMDPATVFWLASMTKAVASVAALREVEQGRLSLDGDLSGPLPEFAGLQVLEGFEADGAPRLRPARRPPTLRQLLTHTSGFGYGFLHGELTRWREAAGVPDPMAGFRAGHAQPLLFEPGEQWAYGIGIDWAGLAVEAASGQRLDAYLTDQVFGPLGMADTGFLPTPEQAARQASPHARGEDGRLAPIPFGLPSAPEVWSGGGGLFGTARDYARFTRMLLNGGTLDGARVLSPETVDMLGEVQTGPLRAGAFKDGVAMTLDFDLFPDQHTGWGLTGLINPEPSADGRGAGSLAWAGIFNTYYWVDRAAGLSGILMTQQTPFGDPDVLGLLSALERDAYRAG